MSNVSFTLVEAFLVGLTYWIAWCEWGPLSFNDASSCGLLIGTFFGDPVKGVILGCSIATLYISNVAVGANAPSDSALAGCIAVPIALKTGMDIETAIALAIPFGVLGVFIDNARRLFAGNYCRMGMKAIEEKRYNSLFIYQIIFPQIQAFVVRCLPVTLLLYLFGGAAGEVVANFPAWLNSGLALVGSMMPGLGLVLCVIFMGKKELLPFFFVGYYICYFTSISYVLVAVIGIVAAIIYCNCVDYKFQEDDDDDDYDDDEEEVVSREKHEIYGEGHAFNNRFENWWWNVRFLWDYRMSQCVEYFYGLGVAFAFRRALAKFMPVESDEYQNAMRRAIQPFITNPHWGQEILSAALAMEEDIYHNGDPDGSKATTVTTFKTSLMGPMAGLGDAIIGGIDFPIWKPIFFSMGVQGNILGGLGIPVLFCVVWNMGIGGLTGIIGYEQGQTGLIRILNSPLVSKLLYGATVLGLVMMGGMAASYCRVPISIPVSGVDMVAVANGILPGILPLIYLTIAYFQLSKGTKFIYLIIATIIFGLLCGILGWA